jgi:hypothetical protein
MPQSIPSASCRASSGHPPLGVGWEQLYQSAVLELNEDRFPERVAVARRAILDRVEEILTTARTDEHHALRDALHFLLLLEEVAARESAHHDAVLKNGRF